MSGINFERLDAAITWAHENPQEFDFGTYYARTPCGTTACLGGHVAESAGWKPVWDLGELDEEDNTSTVEKGGEVRHAKQVAADLIGADPMQAVSLFVLAGTLDVAIWIRNVWAREAGVPERAWGSA